MRDIKFRAWHKLCEVMSKPYDTSYGEIEFHNTQFKYYNRNWLYEDTREDVIEMQYVGLKDKNGREIYEGDIVKSTTQNNIIKFEYGSFKVVGLHEDGYERTYSEMYHFLIDATIPDVNHSKFDGITTTLEVVGNIYENPELIN